MNSNESMARLAALNAAIAAAIADALGAGLSTTTIVNALSLHSDLLQEEE
jgi:hypothetical protein